MTVDPRDLNYLTGTSFSDKELKTWHNIRRADEAHEFWKKNSTSAEIAACAMAGELLALRRLVRQFLAEAGPEAEGSSIHVRAAVRILGFNLNPGQPLFPEWPVALPNPPRCEVIDECWHTSHPPCFECNDRTQWEGLF